MLSTKLSCKWGVWIGAKGLDFDFELFHRQVSDEGADGGTPWQHHGLVHNISLEEDICVFEAELQECVYLSYRHVGPLCKKWVCSFCLTMLMEESTRTEVKMALMS